ncbi:hypothetical protein WDU94_006534, partial [Cyamophila willieti]
LLTERSEGLCFNSTILHLVCLYISISLCLYRSSSRTLCPILIKFGRHIQHGQEIYCIVFGPRWPSPSGASGTSMSKILLT